MRDFGKAKKVSLSEYIGRFVPCYCWHIMHYSHMVIQGVVLLFVVIMAMGSCDSGPLAMDDYECEPTAWFGDSGVRARLEANIKEFMQAAGTVGSTEIKELVKGIQKAGLEKDGGTRLVDKLREFVRAVTEEKLKKSAEELLKQALEMERQRNCARDALLATWRRFLAARDDLQKEGFGELDKELGEVEEVVGGLMCEWEKGKRGEEVRGVEEKVQRAMEKAKEVCGKIADSRAAFGFKKSLEFLEAQVESGKTLGVFVRLSDSGGFCCGYSPILLR